MVVGSVIKVILEELEKSGKTVASSEPVKTKPQAALHKAKKPRQPNLFLDVPEMTKK